MERLIDKIYNKVNGKVNGEINRKNNGEINKLFSIIDIEKIKNVEINNDTNNEINNDTNNEINNDTNNEINNDTNNNTNKKLFIYKNYGIQVKNGIKFKIIFFKMIDETKLERLFELENIKIKYFNPLAVMFKFNEIWNYKLYDESCRILLNYFCNKFNIKAVDEIM